MDVTVLDDKMVGIRVLDAYNSLLWTERYADAGEAILKVDATPENRLGILAGYFLSIPNSREYMMVETREIKDGEMTLTCTSLVGFLKNRFMKRSWDNKYGTVLITNKPGLIPGDIVRQYILPGGAGVMETGGVVSGGQYEMIPNLTVGAEDSTTYPTSLTMSIDNGTVFAGIKQVCDAYNLGFSLYQKNASTLVYTTYSGKDVSGSVRFRSAIDSLLNTSELTSIVGYKNVAYAFAPNVLSTTSYVGYAYESTAMQTTTGFKRRSMMVLVDDIQAGDVDLTTTAGQNAFTALLNAAARNALINNNYVKMIDGEVVPNAFKYGVDYFLGDIVGLAEIDGSSKARVTEYIYSVDDNGVSAYPTLSMV